MTGYRVLSIAATAAFLIAGATTADAQERQRGQFQVEARGGVAVPTGDLADIQDLGPTFGGKLAYKVTPRLGLRADADVAVLQGADLTTVGGDLFEGPDLTFIHYSGGLQYDMSPDPSPWSFVINGGAGATTIDSDAFQDLIGEDPTVPIADGDYRETYFTANGGLQVGYDINQTVNAFVGAQAYVIFADEEDTQVFADLSPTASAFETVVNVPVHAGLMVTFP